MNNIQWCDLSNIGDCEEVYSGYSLRGGHCFVFTIIKKDSKYIAYGLQNNIISKSKSLDWAKSRCESWINQKLEYYKKLNNTRS